MRLAVDRSAGMTSTVASAQVGEGRAAAGGVMPAHEQQMQNRAIAVQERFSPADIDQSLLRRRTPRRSSARSSRCPAKRLYPERMTNGMFADATPATSDLSAFRHPVSGLVRRAMFRQSAFLERIADCVTVLSVAELFRAGEFPVPERLRFRIAASSEFCRPGRYHRPMKPAPRRRSFIQIVSASPEHATTFRTRRFSLLATSPAPSSVVRVSWRCYIHRPAGSAGGFAYRRRGSPASRRVHHVLSKTSESREAAVGQCRDVEQPRRATDREPITLKMTIVSESIFIRSK